MNFDLITSGPRALRFRQALWFFPLAYVLHVLA